MRIPNPIPGRDQAARRASRFIAIGVIVALTHFCAWALWVASGTHICSPILSAEIESGQLVQMTESFRLVHHRYPADLDELATGPNPMAVDVPEDPWGNAYRLRIRDERITVLSSGPDEVEGTTDDIRSTGGFE